MVTRRSTGVLVVGAGPVGLTLAMDLAWRGIDVMVVETCDRGEPPSVKCNHVAARTMEVFRRLGVARAVRDADALPPDYPNDVAFRTTTTGIEFARIHIPCRRDRYTDRSGPDGWWPTSEPPHRINQIYLEPVLFAHATAMPRLQILSRTRLTGFEQSAQAVTAIVRSLDTNEQSTIDCAYMVGCDGAHSEVRRAIGARMSGDPVVQRTQSTFIRAPDLIRRMRAAPAWSTQSLNPRRSANMFAIDGRETWLIHNYLRPEEIGFEAVDRDGCIRTILGVGPDFDYGVISREDWIGRRLVADRFRRDRVFICGDAAHIWVPFAGYGMNAGIADAMNLSWMLAGVLDGWADPAILDAHEAERLPITEQVSHYAMNTAAALARARGAVPAQIEAPGPEGQAARAEFGRIVSRLNEPQYCCGGLNFGYFYDRSPIIAYDGAAAPPYTMDRFEPSTVPGCRTPHLWLRDGRSLYDALGPDFTLLRLHSGADVDPLAAAAARRGVPLAVLDVESDAAGMLYDGARLVLSRPDQHVAWRGNASPRDPDALIDRIRGAAMSGRH
ncbi:MAG TPA: FAD-dependent oxidoreductase [Acetobacteraceae bacterium]|nr:FAD-dependent oxidoreductase [Acetobacteraceae bacterium]